MVRVVLGGEKKRKEKVRIINHHQLNKSPVICDVALAHSKSDSNPGRLTVECDSRINNPLRTGDDREKNVRKLHRKLWNWLKKVLNSEMV